MSNDPGLAAWLASQPLVLLALAGLVAAALGWRLEARSSRTADHMRTAGYLAMGLAGLLIVLDATRQSRYAATGIDLMGQAEARVSGGEALIPPSPAGHFETVASINGHPVPVLIDTGATYTTVEEALARKLDLKPDPTRLPGEMSTANGVIRARYAIARELRLGGIVATNTVIAVIPDTEDPTGVIGMNFLSELESWRVEDGKLHLRARGAPAAPGQGG